MATHSNILAWRIPWTEKPGGLQSIESDMTQRLNNNKHKNNIPGDFPGGPVVKNLLSNAGDMGLIPGWGTKISHITEQLSLHTTTRESLNHKEKVSHHTTKIPACHK